MKTILAAIFVAAFATTAFASETTHNGQLVRDTNVKSVETTGKSFGTSLGQATTVTTSHLGTNGIDAARGARSGK